MSRWKDVVAGVLVCFAVVYLGCGGGASQIERDTNYDIRELLSDAGFDAGKELLTKEVEAEEVEVVDLEGGEVAPVPGGFGYPCSSNEECQSGFCVETQDNFVCTITCVQDCPPGWDCVQVGSSEEGAWICLNKFGTLCRPCVSDDECRQGATVIKSYCVSYGPQGKYCATECGTSEDCPQGYMCQPMELADGSVAKVCISETATCGCAKKYVGMELKTECYKENEYGICYGERVCKEGQLTECDAPEPAQEECNGIDDDCDGKTDEELEPEPCLVQNQYGSCPGETVCQDGELVCVGPEPQPEECDGQDNDCDGLTDEDFPDQDGDGIADCVDQDPDGDGILTPQDNCPNKFNPAQENHDLDQEGDACDPDDDNDLSPDDEDCDPFNPTIYPGAEEKCDGIDQNCDGVADDGFPDTDGDGDADCIDDDDDNDGIVDILDNCPLVSNPFQTDNDKDNVGDACDEDDDNDGEPDVTDCQPLDPEVFPGQTEKCDGIDNDCDGETDEDFSDLDEDGLADCVDPDDDGDSVVDEVDNCPVTPNPDQADFDQDGIGDACETDFDGDGDPDNTDCAPQDPNIHHGALETCNGIDDNCNDIVDEGYPDTNQDGIADCISDDDDGDGIPDEEDNCPKVVNPDQGDLDEDGIGDVCDDDKDGDGEPNLTDCNPIDPEAHHGAQEVCNGKDDDCDYVVDEEGAEGCVVYYYDYDGDGYGVEGNSKCLCAPTPPYTAQQTGDCDNNNSQVFPGATEVCNSKDDNCDGVIDEPGANGCVPMWPDEDGDGYGAIGDSECLCANTPGYSQLTGDCDDSNPAVSPVATEKCDGVDNDCNGLVDEEGAIGCQSFYIDNDGDGYGALMPPKCLCEPEDPYTANVSGDCDDSDSQVYPSAEETCNQKDDNCNGVVDEGVTHTYYKDNDGDGYGTPTDKVEACEPPEGYVDNGTDCNDFNANIHPGAEEICNEIDDDCNGEIDNGLEKVDVYPDLDGDGHGSESSNPIQHCLIDGQFPPAGYSLTNDDCNDTNSNVYPGAPELCDGILNDCTKEVPDYQCPHVCEGDWPVYIGTQNGYVAVANLDSDNEWEVVAIGGGKCRAINHDGTILWEASCAQNYGHVNLADLDRDDTLDVIACNGTNVRVINGKDGSILAEYSGGCQTWYGTVSFDLDNDGYLDIVPAGHGMIHFTGANQELVQSVQLNPLPDTVGFSLMTPLIVDLNGDGIAEVGLGSGTWGGCSGDNQCDGRFYLFNPDGSYYNDPTYTDPNKPWFHVDFPAYAGEGVFPMYADFDGDGENEVYENFKGQPGYVWTKDGQVEDYNKDLGWKLFAPVKDDYTIDTSGSVRAVSGPLVDIDNDGIYEEIRRVSGGWAVYKQGKPMNGYPINVSVSYTPTIADLDRDGKLDVLFVGSSNASVNCYELGEGTYHESRVLLYDFGLLGRLWYRTETYDPYEPNDIRTQPFDPENTTDPVHDSRAFWPRGLRDFSTVGSGKRHRIVAAISEKGDRDYYVFYGSWWFSAYLSKTRGKDIDLDLRVYIYNSSGQYLGKLESTHEGTAQEHVRCHGADNPCPSGAHTFIVEIRGKDENKDYGPWPYMLDVWGGQ